MSLQAPDPDPVSYTHLRAHETVLDIVCRLLLEKKKSKTKERKKKNIYVYKYIRILNRIEHIRQTIIMLMITSKLHKKY